MELLSILNELEEFVQKSPRVPMTKKVVVSEEELLDYLDRARTILPEEMRKAKWLMQEREKVISESRSEATKILEEAQKEKEKKVNQSEIIQEAREQAETIMNKAEKNAHEMRIGARDYSDDVLNRLEERLVRMLKEIEGGRKELKNIK